MGKHSAGSEHQAGTKQVRASVWMEARKDADRLVQILRESESKKK